MVKKSLKPPRGGLQMKMTRPLWESQVRRGLEVPSVFLLKRSLVVERGVL
jgi:hypothetical protein